ncbi:MAG TPA: lipid II flippase MurJ [Thermoanaerobaculia bacterium]|nr:lipid II flippase MurJ [Thermoanaerobaculia bacterium]
MSARAIRSLLRSAQRAPVVDALSATGFTLVGKSVGFLVPLFVAAQFGVTAATDAFFFVLGTVLAVTGVLAALLELVVPSVAELRGRDEELAAFMNGLLGTATLAVALGFAAFLAVLGPLLPVVTRFPAGDLALVARLLLETSPLVLLVLWGSVLSGYLNAHRVFGVPALTPAVRGAVAIACVLLFGDTLGVHALPLGYVAGETARLVVLGVAVRRRAPFPLRPELRRDSRLAGFYRALGYPAVATVLTLVNPFVDSIAASWLAPGSVTVLRYAESLYMIPFSLFTGGLVPVFLAHWSDRARDGELAALRRDVTRSARLVLWLTVAVATVLALLSRPIASLLLAHGSFDAAKVPQVALVWACCLAAFPAQAVAQLHVKALFVLRRTRIVMVCALCVAPLNLVLDLLLMRVLGVAGIALSTAGTALVTLAIVSSGLRTAFVERARGAGGGDVPPSP